MMMTRSPAIPERYTATLLGRTGLIRVCQNLLRASGEPRLYSVTAVPASTSVYTHSNLVGHANAAGFTYEHALHAAIGECIERYSCLYYDPDELVHASKNQLSETAVGMDRFAIYADWQYERPGFPFARWRADQPISWCAGQSLGRPGRCYVPAAVVHVPFHPRHPGDALCCPVSTGQACHVEWEQAVLTGLFEAVERDAFVISWLRKLPLIEIDYQADPVIDEVYRRHFAGSGFTYRVFDMTLDIKIPSFLCIVEGQSARGPIVGMGAATRMTERQAIIKALLEAGQDIIWCLDLIRQRPDWRPKADWSNVVDFEDHVRLYCEPEMRAHLAFFMDTSPRRAVEVEAEPADSKEALARCLAEIRRADLDCVVVDTTAPDVDAAGFNVVKVLLPGSATLSSMHHLQALGSPRIWTVPDKLGYGAQASPTLNPIPHPFP